MDQIEVKLTRVKETKRTFRFETDDEEAPVGNIYVQKSAFKGEFPETITVTIQAS